MQRWIAIVLLASLPGGYAFAGQEAGDRSFTISGTGNSSDDFDFNSFGISGQYSWFRSDSLELGIRQSVNGIVLEDANDTYGGATFGFIGYHFGQDKWVPYLGANLGGLYGEQINETFAAGLEAGIRYYALEKTFIAFQMQYEFLFEDSDDIDDNFDDGAFFYTLGVGFNF